jgi:hypothetical protein
MFRTYELPVSKPSKNPEWKPLNPGPSGMSQIWEVARATSAVPTLFPQIHLEDHVFIDGGVMANNPTQEALREVAFLCGGELAGTCIVSIGSGFSNKPRPPASPQIGTRFGINKYKDSLRILRAAVTQTELTDNDVHFEASMNLGFRYFRFNPILDRDIPIDDWDKLGRTREEIELSTKQWLENEAVQVKLRQCASAIVARRVHGGNVHFVVPRTPNSLFTGRTDLLHHIQRCLRSRDNTEVDLPRIFVISGMGGQGKSEICLKLAHNMREECVTYIHFDCWLRLLSANVKTGSGVSSGLMLTHVFALKATSLRLRVSLEFESKIYTKLSSYLQIPSKDGSLS